MKKFVQTAFLSGIFLVYSHGASAVVNEDAQNSVDKQLTREEASHKQQAYVQRKAKEKVDRELHKKRLAQWKKERAQLNNEYRQKRSERLMQIEAEREKELAARARVQEIKAQMKMEEADLRARLHQLKAEIVYGEPKEEIAEEEGPQEETFGIKSLWDRLFKKSE